MMRDANEVEQIVARTLRDSLARLRRSSDELQEAVSDVVSACASTRPANSLPPIIRAQTAAASLAASLDVLARFITTALQPGLLSSGEQDASAAKVMEPRLQVAALGLTRPPEVRAPFPENPKTPETPKTPEIKIAASPQSAAVPATAPVISEAAMESQPAPTVEEWRASDMVDEGAPVVPPAGATLQESMAGMPGGDASARAEQEQVPDVPNEAVSAVAATEELSAEVAAFDIAKLPAEEQELHRRANRVAKVSMQDIRMLRPNDVKSGKEHKDLCHRLRDDIERAHKEYDRRFQAILGHPVDYFYDWMVEILADGDPGALGEYPYPSPVLRH
jgi:hypothetical protein